MQRDLLLLAEMIDAAEQTQLLVADVEAEELAKDRQRRDALLWNFAVLGGAAAQVSQELKDRFTDVPWAQPTRMRNRLIHGYWSVDLEIPYTTAKDLLPEFVKQLRIVLAELEAEDAPPDPTDA